MLAMLGKLSLGLIMGFGGLGSCLGIRAAGISAAAAWAKEGKEGKALSGKYNGLVGMPVSQTLYSMILYFLMRPFASMPENGGVLLGIAVGVGLCELFSAYVQGMIGGAGVRALVDNGGKGFGNIIVAMGIAESVGLFAMVVGILILNSDVMVKVAEVAATAP
jgi:V/A-type H+-transporting ATPase subunit K